MLKSRLLNIGATARTLAFFSLLVPTLAFGASPVLHYSDLNWGPKTGWEGSATKGAAVTVWGQNLGTSRGTSFVTVNGAQLSSDTDYAEWGVTDGSRGLQRITFWLNSNCADGAGSITINVDGATSNALPFNVSPGTIYFISATDGSNSNNGLYSSAHGSGNGPFHDVYMFGFQHNPSGDGQYIAYVRGGTYNTPDTTGDSTMISYRGPSGGPTRQKALVGYPGETPILDATGMTRGIVWNADYSPYGRNGYVTYSKLTMANGSYALYIYGDYVRVIGNHFQNMLDQGWVGIVHVSNSQYAKVYGNFFDHCGATVQGSYKHNVYVNTVSLSEVVANRYSDIGWNEFANPEAGTDNRGGVIFARTDSTVAATVQTQDLSIHDNYFHGGTQNFVEIGDGPVQRNIWIYNNVFTGGSSVNSPLSIRWTTANANLFNNTFYLAGSAALPIVQVVGITPPGSQLNSANNVFYAAPGQSFFNVVSGSSLTSDHDLFFSSVGATVPSGSGITLTNGLTGDPLFVNAASADFHLQSGSPAIDAGATVSTVTEDYDGNPRPQGSGYDAGAFEYGSGTAASAVTVSVSPTAASLTAGQTQQLSATVGGNSNTSVTWSMSPSVGTLSGTGLYTAPSAITSQQTVQVTATSAADTTKSATATITLNPTVAVAITVSPASASLTAGQTQQFAAAVTGTTTTGVTWTLNPAVGTLSASGLYTAPGSISAQQTVVVTATSAADTTKSASASITLNPTVAVAITVSPASASLTAGQTQQFAAAVTGTTTTGVTWTLNPAVGTLSAAGLYTAPGSISAQQTVVVTATSAADTTKSASASITLNPTVAVAITVSPASASLTAGQTQQFAAAVTGTTTTGVTWTLNPAVGTLSAAGLYTAPGSISAQQTVVVTATSAADATKSASAAITLNPTSTSGGGTSTSTNGYSVSWSQLNANQIKVSWVAPAGHSNYDAIRLSGVDAVGWWYTWQTRTSSATSGSAVVSIPTATGLWEFRYDSRDTGKTMARSTALPVNVAAFTLTPADSGSAGTLSVSFTAPSGRPQTWADQVGLYLVGTTNDKPVWHQYTMGATSGNFTLPAPTTPGAYEYRYLLNYVDSAISTPITIN